MTHHPTLLLISILLLSGCQPESPTFDKALETEKILSLHQLQRQYHFEKMAEEFASQMAPDHYSVNRGEIKKPAKEENIERYNNYFGAVEFEKWDDLNPPIIRFSDDGTMAYTIVNKEVIITYEHEEGKRTRETTEFAWVAIYKKYDGEWKIDCMASTNKPGEMQTITNQ